jgi:hypothetical protein
LPRWNGRTDVEILYDPKPEAPSGGGQYPVAPIYLGRESSYGTDVNAAASRSRAVRLENELHGNPHLDLGVKSCRRAERGQQSNDNAEKSKTRVHCW